MRQVYPREVIYVDAINGDMYYCDSQKFVLEKLKAK